MTAPAARNRRGLYTIPHPDTHEIHELPSFSKLKNQIHAEGLEKWKLGIVAGTIARRADLQLLAAAGDREAKEAAQQALDAGRGASNSGTAIHKYTEMLDLGTLDWDMLPPVAVARVEAYRDLVEAHQIRPFAVEKTVYNLTVGYAGTPDLFAEIGPSDDVFAIDRKTGNVYREVALQLRAYAGGEGFWTPPGDLDLPRWLAAKQQLERDVAAGVNPPPTATGKKRAKWNPSAVKEAEQALDELYWQEFAAWPGHQPMPERIRTDVGYVIHWTDDVDEEGQWCGRCELLPVDLEGIPSANDVLVSLVWMFRWQGRRDIVGDPIEPGENLDVPVGSAGALDVGPDVCADPATPAALPDRPGDREGASHATPESGDDQPRPVRSGVGHSPSAQLPEGAGTHARGDEDRASGSPGGGRPGDSAPGRLDEAAGEDRASGDDHGGHDEGLRPEPGGSDEGTDLRGGEGGAPVEPTGDLGRSVGDLRASSGGGGVGEVAPDPGDPRRDAITKRLAAEIERPGDRRVSPGLKRSWLRARLQHDREQTPGILGTVAAQWPAGVPPLKQEGQTAEHLDAVIDLLNRVEAEHEIKFGPALWTFLPAPAADDLIVAEVKHEAEAEAVRVVTNEFPDSTVLATEQDRLTAFARLEHIVNTDRAVGQWVAAESESHGIRKSLRTAEWTPDELETLALILASAERTIATQP